MYLFLFTRLHVYLFLLVIIIQSHHVYVRSMHCRSWITPNIFVLLTIDVITSSHTVQLFKLIANRQSLISLLAVVLYL